MHIEFDLPEVPVPRTAVSDYWDRYIFVGSPSANHHINAFASNYVRLVEAAIVEYGLASASLRQVWSDHTSIGLGAMHQSISHFESCVTNMHRAINAYRRLRNHKSRDPMSIHPADQKPKFVSDKIATQVRNMRDSIHHFEDKVINGEVAEGQPIAIKPDGPEVAHQSESGQTIKTFDRLVIGPHQLIFSDVAEWLNEMSGTVARIARYERSQGTVSP